MLATAPLAWSNATSRALFSPHPNLSRVHNVIFVLLTRRHTHGSTAHADFVAFTPLTILTTFYPHGRHRVHVISTDALPEDSRITGPMIVVHIVDSSTGRYITRTANPEVIFSPTMQNALSIGDGSIKRHELLSRQKKGIPSSHNYVGSESATNQTRYILLALFTFCFLVFMEEEAFYWYSVPQQLRRRAEVYPTEGPHDDILLASAYNISILILPLAFMVGQLKRPT